MTKKIILADDNLWSRDGLVSIINDAVPGVEIEQVVDGRSLVERVRGGGFALVLTDNQMPYVSGLEAIRQIREFNREVPIFIITSSDVEREALEAGATGYMRKSYCSSKLPQVLQQYLG
ncbi:response regulator transcription factor [Candidatus Woesearchaeota archaeon]|nr:response regulator transcription factor [Candidatus Woesearchaeota archaeon]